MGGGLVINYRRLLITSMAIRPKRASLTRVIIGLASLAFPLIATGAAQAALAGATPATTTQRPDLRSATINPTAGSTGVEVCFDKVLNTIGAGPGAFHLVGYRAGNVSAAASNAFIDQTNTQCAIVVFPASVGDLAQYTAVEVDPSAVIGNSALALNLADSVGLTGSTSHAGTTGVTTAPNLVGILAPTGTNIGTNSLTYVFDKTTSTAVPPNPADFFYVDPAGNTCTGAAVIAGAGTTTLTVAFGPCAGGSTVATAARGGVFVSAVTSASDPASNSPNQSVVLPNAPNGGTTQVPDLVSAVINSDQDTVTYTFDKNVVLNGTGVGTFQVDLAFANNATSTGATANGGTTVVARFSGNLSVQSEFGVIAWVSQNAVKNADNPGGNGNAPGSANVGDNAGAFARAFTTGPEVFGATASKSTGAVTVNLDDRISASSAGNVTLYDTSGNAIAAPAPAVSFNSSAGPGPAVATLQYPASSLTNLGSVQFNQGAFSEPAVSAGKVWSPADAQNIQQIVSPVSSAAILKGYKAYKAHKAHHHTSHKKHTKKHTKKH